MATVPRLELTGTTPGALPGVKQSSVASPELFGAAADQDGKLASAVGGAGDVVFKAAMEEAERASVAAVQDARTELGRRSQLFVEDLRKNNLGQAAAGSAQAFSDWHAKQAEEIGKGLQGRETQRAFGVMAKQHSVAGRSDVANFENHETVKYRADSYNRANDGYVQQAAMATTDVSYIDARNNLVASVQARAATEKWDSAQYEDNMRDALSKMHEARAKALATDVNGAANPKAALEYIKGVDAKEINPLVRAQLTAGLKSQNDQQTALDKVTEYMVKFTPANKEDPIPFEKIDAALRAEFKDNPEALRAARAEAHHRTSTYNADLQQVEAKSLSSMYDMYNKKMSPAAIQASPEYVNAGPKAKMQFNKMMEDDLLRREQLAATRTNRAAAQESREYTAMMRKAHIMERDNKADTLPFLNPDRLRTMSEWDVRALQGKIGLENMVSVHAKWLQVQAGGEKLKDAQLDHDTFQAVAVNANVLPRDGKPTREQMNNAVLLKNNIELELNKQQQVTKQPLTRAERDKTIQRVIDAKVMEGIFNNKTRIVGTMSDDEVNSRMTAGEKAYVTDVIVKAKDAGPVTPASLANVWRAQVTAKGKQFFEEVRYKYPDAAMKKRQAEESARQVQQRNTGG